MIPNVVMIRPDLSPGAKITYAYFSHVAWRGNRDEVETPQAALARDLGVTDKTARGYVNELVRARLLSAKRRGLGLSNLYTIHDPVEQAESATVETAVEEPQDGPLLAGAGSLPGKDLELRQVLPPTPHADPPAVWLDDGQNLPFNSLRDICGIDPASPRCSEVAAALNGRGKEPGIRALFWEECVRHVAENGGGYPDPELFARALSRRIALKGQIYLDSCEVALTPTALRKYWFEPDALAKRAARKNRGMTPDDIRAMAHDDIEVRRAS